MSAVRAAVKADLDPVMVIERASFPTDAWSAGQMRDACADGDAFVVEHEGAIAGYAVVLAPPGSGDADVLTIAVAEGARRLGLGRALLRRMLDVAHERRAHRVFLEVRADNPGAEALYAAHGFRRVGLRRRYYQPDGVDAIVMRLDLEGGDA